MCAVTVHRAVPCGGEKIQPGTELAGLLLKVLKARGGQCLLVMNAPTDRVKGGNSALHFSDLSVDMGDARIDGIRDVLNVLCDLLDALGGGSNDFPVCILGVVRLFELTKGAMCKASKEPGGAATVRADVSNEL